MTRWGEQPYYPMDRSKRAPGVAKGVDQTGTGPGEKRCSKCGEVHPLAGFTAGKGLKGKRSQCKQCENRRQRKRREDGKVPPRDYNPDRHGYVVMFDPTRTYAGLFHGVDFRMTLRLGWWPDGMIVEHRGKLLVVKGDRLHEADQRATSRCQASRVRWARHRDLQDDLAAIASTDWDTCLSEYSIRGRVSLPGYERL